MEMVAQSSGGGHGGGCACGAVVNGGHGAGCIHRRRWWGVNGGLGGGGEGGSPRGDNDDICTCVYREKVKVKGFRSEEEGCRSWWKVA